MAETLREKLIRAAEGAAQYEQTGVDFEWQQIANWPQIIDAILAECEADAESRADGPSYSDESTSRPLTWGPATRVPILTEAEVQALAAKP